MSCNALDGYQMLHKHHENVPLHEKCNNRKKQYMPVYDLCYFDILVYTSICQYMKYIPSYTCIYFDILLTSDLSEVSGFQMYQARSLESGPEQPLLLSHNTESQPSSQMLNNLRYHNEGG